MNRALILAALSAAANHVLDQQIVDRELLQQINDAQAELRPKPIDPRQVVAVITLADDSLDPTNLDDLSDIALRLDVQEWVADSVVYTSINDAAEETR